MWIPNTHLWCFASVNLDRAWEHAFFVSPLPSRWVEFWEVGFLGDWFFPTFRKCLCPFCSPFWSNFKESMCSLSPPWKTRLAQSLSTVIPHHMCLVKEKRRKVKRREVQGQGGTASVWVSLGTLGSSTGVPLCLVKFYCMLELCVPNCWEWKVVTQKSEFHCLWWRNSPSFSLCMVCQKMHPRHIVEPRAISYFFWSNSSAGVGIAVLKDIIFSEGSK